MTSRGVWASVNVAAVLLAGVHIAAAEQERPASLETAMRAALEAAASVSVTEAKPLRALDAAGIEGRWGIQIEGIRLTAAGYMLDFRYRVLDAAKAAPLFVRKTKPVLRDEATGAVMVVPVPPKTGALRSSNEPQEGRTYFMFFANPGRFITKNRKVSVTIGDFAISGLVVR